VAILVMESFPESDPDVEQAETTAQPAEKTGSDETTYDGILQQEIVIHPLRSPRKDYKQNSGHGTDQDEKKNRRAVQP
jgi:hypothetical protein